MILLSTAFFLQLGAIGIELLRAHLVEVNIIVLISTLVLHVVEVGATIFRRTQITHMLLIMLILSLTLVESAIDGAISIDTVVTIRERMIAGSYLISKLLLHFVDSVRVVCLLLGRCIITIVFCI